MRTSSWIVGFILAGCLVACSEDKTKLAPEVKGSALASSAPKTAGAKQYMVDPGASTVGFMMDAPDEKIRGKAPDSVSGKVFIDPKDLSQTTGNIVVDIDKLELFQRKKDETGNFTEEVKQPKQNEHARAWLEIDSTTPEAMRKDHQRVEFRIESVEGLTEKDVTKLQGNERSVNFTVKGEFLLHKRSSKKSVEMQAVFMFDGDTPTGIRLKTVKPFSVSLAEHDVRPRDAFGKLAAKTLDDLGSKVAKDAMVEFDIGLGPGEDASKIKAPPMPATATASATAAESAAPAPEASASAATSASAGAGSAAVSASAAPSASAGKPAK